MPPREFGKFGPSLELKPGQKIPALGGKGKKEVIEPGVESKPHLTTPESAIVHGIATGDLGDKVGVFGSTVSGVGLWGRAESPGALAGNFEGNVKVTGAFHARGSHLFDGDIEVTGDISLANADCAEDFNVIGAVKMDPGTVMVLATDGAVSESQRAYDKRVAGVISGAGSYRPGLVLDKRQSSGIRQPIALMGKVFCKVDAQFGAIDVGDLLTTSPTPGHAMVTRDPFAAFGAVLGKALRPLRAGQGMIPVLVALQ